MIHIFVIMLIRGRAPRCGGMSAREALPPRLGPVSGCIYKKRFTCVCVCYNPQNDFLGYSETKRPKFKAEKKNEMVF